MEEPKKAVRKRDPRVDRAEEHRSDHRLGLPLFSHRFGEGKGKRLGAHMAAGQPLGESWLDREGAEARARAELESYFQVAFPFGSDPRVHALSEQVTASVDYLTHGRHIAWFHEHISRLLLEFVAAPISSARLEDLFSVAGLQRRNGRGRMRMDTLNALSIARLRPEEFPHALSRAVGLWCSGHQWRQQVTVSTDDGAFLNGVRLIDEFPNDADLPPDEPVAYQDPLVGADEEDEDFQAHDIEVQADLLPGEDGRKPRRRFIRRAYKVSDEHAVSLRDMDVST